MWLIRFCLSALPLWLGMVPLALHAAEPYTPASADTVLLQRTSTRAAQPPPVGDDPAQKPRAVQAALEQGQRTGDPRYYGQAQALMGSDWSAANPALPLRLLRARLLQQRHDFKAALADLDAVLAAEPRNSQAHLVRANILMVQGLPQQARRHCAALLGEAGFLVTATCLGAVNGLSGQAASGLQVIETALAREPDAAPALRTWALTQAAEIAERLGDVPRATEHYARALAEAAAAGDNDVYLKAAHADFLLNQARPAEVKAALATEAAFDPLLLRLAMAEQQLANQGDARAKGAVALHLKDLRARFALAAERGDAPHHREETMTALHLNNNSQAALELAQQNWAEQREPADARLLLLAARAAQNPAAAAPVLEWMKTTGIEDVRLNPLAAQLGRAP